MEENFIDGRKAPNFKIVNQQHRRLIIVQHANRCEQQQMKKTLAATTRTPAVPFDEGLLVDFIKYHQPSFDKKQRTLQPIISTSRNFFPSRYKQLLHLQPANSIDSVFRDRKVGPEASKTDEELLKKRQRGTLQGLQYYISQTLNQEKYKKNLSKEKAEDEKNNQYLRGISLNLERQFSWRWPEAMSNNEAKVSRLTLEQQQKKRKITEQMKHLIAQQEKLLTLRDLNVRNTKFLSAPPSPPPQATSRLHQFPRNFDTIQVNNISLQIRKRNRELSQKGKKKVPQQQKKPLELEEFICSSTFRKLQLQDQDLAEELKNLQSQSITILSKDTILLDVNGEIRRQMASLTKIANCVISLYLSTKYSIDLKTVIKIPRKAASIPGTTAQLKAGDRISLRDLMHGMMLPSGNDAAYALADFFGRIVYQHSQEFSKRKEEELKKKHKIMVQKGELYDAYLPEVPYLRPERKSFSELEGDIKVYSSHQTNIQYFIKHMNELCRYLKLTHTYFTNPHGLSDKRNHSSSNDLAYLCFYAMTNSSFREIVSTKEYSVEIYNDSTRLKRETRWINTNRLLSLEECQGIKTGVTSTAGPCMAACFQRANFEAIIVILKTNTLSNRFNEVQYLFNWAYQKFSDKLSLSSPSLEQEDFSVYDKQQS